MKACCNGFSAFLLVFSASVACGDRTNFVAACDEGGKVYVADWNVSSNRFENFRRVATLHDSEGEYPHIRAVSVGDFNGDGYDDIAVVRRIYYNRGAVHLLMNDGGNAFRAGRAIDFPLNASEWIMDGCAGDFNNDGIDDFTFNGNNNYLHIWTSDGRGGFSYAVRTDLRWYGRGTDCADFNNDGNLDIFRATYSNGGFIQYLEGNGDGTFKAAVDYPHTGDDPYGVALGDFDGDGDIDRIADSGSGGDPRFYQNTGAVFFADAVYIPSLDYNNHGSYDAYDYDADGCDDIVVTDYSWLNLRFFRNNGDGTFTNSVTLGTLPGYTMAVSAPPLPPLASKPAAVAEPSVQRVDVSAAASFDSSASSSPNGAIVSNRWDFGDGDVTPWLPAAVGVTSHVYAAEGHYRARLSVLDVEGYGAARTVDVFVEGGRPSVVTDELNLGEADAVNGVWPIDIPVTNFVTDAEGLSDYCWVVSNVVDIGFEDGAGGNWFAQDGIWVVTNSHAFSGANCYRQLSTTADRTRNLLDLEIEGDFVFEADCMIVGGAGEEIILNLSGYGWYNTYDIIIRGRGNDDLRVDRIVQNGTAVLYNNYLGFVLTNNVPVHAEIHRIGDEITVYVNGGWVASLKDGTWMKGRIGLGTYDTDAVFDNVRVHAVGCGGNVRTTLREGSYTMAIAASDGALQTTNLNVGVVCLNDGTAPVADAGADISLDESAATNGVWVALLDGSGSSDAESPSGDLSYVWDFGLETFDFDGSFDLDNTWYASSGTYQTNQIVLPNQGGWWGSSYAVTRHTVQRTAGTVFQARVRSTGESMAGFFHTSGFSYTHMPYAIYFAGSAVYIYEDGNYRGFVIYYNNAYYYDVRIELKADRGALYYIRRSDAGAPWALIYDSDYSAADNLRRGITLANGTAWFDDFDRSVYGMAPQLPVCGTGEYTVQLTLFDPVGNSDTDTVKITTAGNNPPVADAGPDRILGEADAVYKVWTVDFDASDSSDDFGIYLYEWDWNFSGVFHPSGDEGVNQSHQWSEAGVYHVGLRVTDHALQSDVTNITVTITDGTDPVAGHGGPYYFDEFSGNASNGYWNVALDAGSTLDNESTNLVARWSLGDDPLDDPRLLDLKWVHDAGTVITNGMMRLGADGGGHYAYTREVFRRLPGLRAEGRMRTSADSEQVFGFKSDDANVGWNYWVYGLALDNGQISFWEYGSWGNTGHSYNLNEWYDFRIELKDGAGAVYYYKPAATNEWTLLRDSNAHANATFRRGFYKHSGTTTCEADSYHEWAAGTNTSYKLYLHHLGTNDVELTVIDQALHSDTVSTTITCMTNAAPVAAFYPQNLTLNESQAVNGIWEVPFSALLSTDDHGVWKYEWDFDYDAIAGFMPGGTSPTLVRQYTVPGTYPVALRVTDHLLQQHLAFGQIVCYAGTNPVAVIPASYIIEKGWAVEFDGTASTDDSGVVGYEWDFGDGSTGSGARPVHVYTAETNTLLRLRVFDGVGQASDWVTATVAVVTGSVPAADAGSGYTAAAGGPPVYFDGSGSTDDADPSVIQGVARYHWDIDIATDSDSDGNPSNDLNYVVANPFHVYALSGVYTSRLVVVDGAGQSATNDAVVTIADNLPPDVICVPWHGDVSLHHKAISGEAVTLKAVVRDAGNLTHQWLFGDGSSSAVTPVNNKYAVEIDHVYNGVPGQPFTATLIVWDSVGNEGRDNYLVMIAPDDDATRADIAIDRGLWWLHKDQDKASGRWNSAYGGYWASGNGSALLAIQMNAHRLLGDPEEDPYVETIRLGFDYLFQLLAADAIGLQNGNDPDTNGNGIGLRTAGGNAGYQLGMVMDAIAASRAHLAVAPSGPAGTVRHRFFLDILTDMVDEYAWGQHDSGGMRGGWRYDMNGGSDNSAAQWGAIGLLAAKEMFGINIPQFVINENKIWLNASRNGVNYGYDGPNPAWGFYSTTPSAMVQMCLDGILTTNPLWTVTEDQMRNVWPIDGFASKHYYGNYAFVKAMRSAKPSPVGKMHLDGFDWYADPVEGIRVKVTGQQENDGSWYAYAQNGSGYPLYKTLSTSWAIAMLTPSLFSVPPVAVIDAPTHWPYGTNLVLNAERSYHPDANRSIVRYSWDLNGDGIYTVITNEPYAVLNIPGSEFGDTVVTVRLRVTDDNDPAVSSETTATIQFGQGPFPPFAVPGDEYSGYAEVPLQFDGSASWDLDGHSITNYIWDFTNDGTNDLVTTSPISLWTYSVVGEYAAGLRVVDDGPAGLSTSSWKFVMVSITEPPEYPLPVGIDQENRLWNLGGDGVWTGQIVRTHDTVDAGASPALTDLQSAWFETTVDGPGVVSFWWKVSSEEYFDWLYFKINGGVYRAISGEVDWQYVSVDVPEGACALRWEYFKDKTLSEGRDQGFVDQVVWIPDNPLTGFGAWANSNNLAGARFEGLSPLDAIPYGFLYAFGLDPSVSNDIVLITLSRDSGYLFVDTPEQDPATVPYVDVTVKATTNLLSGVWPFNLNPTNNAAVPMGREWWVIPGGYPTMFFKLRAEEK